MTPEGLRELIAAGESLDVEFKGEEWRPVSDGELIEAVVCLANRSSSDPAWLLVGVEDDGRITGARPRHGNTTDPLRVQALVANRTRPALSVRVEIVPLDNKDVLVVEVPSVRSPIGTADGKYLRRAVGGDGRPACVPMHFHEMQALQADRGVLDYSALAVPEARWEDLDPLEFERFRRFIRESRGQGDANLLHLSDLELAKALGALQANPEVTAVRVLGLLLFGREEVLARLLPTHEVAFQILSGQKVEVNDFFRWPLLRVMEELLARFRAHNREEELLVGMLRVGVPDYPPAAFREGVANALIHRDYTRVGAVHVQWHDDRVEISNPGASPRACGSTTCSSPSHALGIPCWPMPSSAPASSSARRAVSTPSSTNNCATAAPRRTTSAATKAVSCWCCPEARPTSSSRAWWQRKARPAAHSR